MKASQEKRREAWMKVCAELKKLSMMDFHGEVTIKFYGGMADMWRYTDQQRIADLPPADLQALAKLEKLEGGA